MLGYKYLDILALIVTCGSYQLLAQCPIGLTDVKYHESYCYSLSSDSKTWEDAAKACQQTSTHTEPGRLLSVRNSGIWSELYYWTSEIVWTSGYTTDIDDLGKPHSAATWYWANASIDVNPDTYGDLSASLSILSYPSSNSSGPCLGISRYQWEPQQCSQQHRFICEYGPCGSDIKLNGTSELIVTPRYPWNYPASSYCEWFIDVGKGHAVLNFDTFELEGGSCSYDSVRVHRNKNSALLTKRCGQTIPPDIRSTDQYMYIAFSTDGSDQFKGFKATIRSSEDPVTHRITGEHGIVSTENFPELYGSSQTVEWQISVDDGGTINLQFTDFELQSADTSGACVYDSLTIRIGNSNGPLYGNRSYCGNDRPEKLSSQGASINIKFTSDSSIESAGFRAIFWSSRTCVKVISQGGGVISSPGYPSAFFGKCTWYIDVLEGVAKLNFVPLPNRYYSYYSSYCSDFSLEVKNGLRSSSSELTSFCGYNTRSNVTSPTRYLTVNLEIESSGSSSRSFRKFNATFRSSTNCSEQLVMERGSFHSPNYPDYYDPYTKCSWLIDVETGNATLSIDYFSFYRHDCSEDKLEIFDGDSANSTQLATLCGYLTSIPIIVGSSPHLFIQMVSDGSGRGSGFSANFWSSEVDCTMWGMDDVYTMKYNNTCYGFFKTKRTWTSALSFCESKNSSMATFESDATYNALKDWVFNDLASNYYFWTAGYRRVGTSHQWYWKTFLHGDIPIDPSLLHWKAGQPNDNAEYIYMRSDGLYDYGPSEINYVMCEENSRVTALEHITSNYCSPPPYLSNGVYTPSQVRYGVGTSITFQCDDRYTLQGDSSLVCRNGLWSGHFPTCTAVTTTTQTPTTTEAPPSSCLPLPSIQYGSLSPSQTNYEHGSMITAVCNSGYELHGNPDVRCNNGQWLGSLPSCVPTPSTTVTPDPIQCDFPANTGLYSSFYPKKDKYDHSETVYLLCDYAGEPSQNHSMTCIHGYWSSSFPFPSCQNKTIQKPAAPGKAVSDDSLTESSTKAANTKYSKLVGGLVPVLVILVLVIIIGGVILHMKYQRNRKTNLLLLEMDEES